MSKTRQLVEKVYCIQNINSPLLLLDQPGNTARLSKLFATMIFRYLYPPVNEKIFGKRRIPAAFTIYGHIAKEP